MARKSTIVPESALMEAFESGRMAAWDSAYDAGYENGYAAARVDSDAWDCSSHYQHGRADAADSFADWLDTLPADVYEVLRPHITRALVGALSPVAPF